MHVIYAPIDPSHGDRQEWTFTPGRVPADEMELIEDHFGGTWREFVQGVQTGRTKALRLLLWLCRRLEQKASPHHRGPLAQLRDVAVFVADEVKVLSSSPEIREQLEQVEKSAEGLLTPEQRAAALAAGQRELDEALSRESGLFGPVPMPADGVRAAQPEPAAEGAPERPQLPSAFDPRTLVPEVPPLNVAAEAARVDAAPLPEASGRSGDAIG